MKGLSLEVLLRAFNLKVSVMKSANNFVPQARSEVLQGGLKYGPRRYRSMRNSDSDIVIEAQLLDYARRLSREQQQELMQRLDEVASGMKGELAGQKAKQNHSNLLNEVEDFVRHLEAGDYFEGWGWDARIQEERAWGDESWARDMDELFKRVNSCFLSGPRALAGECYSRMLRTFLVGDEAGIFCGAEPAERMLDSDLNVLRARYFRCIYEQTPLSKRAEQLFLAFEEFDGVGTSTLGLQAIMDVDKTQLSEFKSFLAQWIEFLRSREQECSRRPSLFEWERPGQWLLREAVQLERGAEGLADLARERGALNAEAYHQWISALMRERQFKRASFAAREASERVEDGEDRACMAEIWAELSCRNGGRREVLGARRRAFRASPNARRLLEYCAEGGPGQKALRARIKTELDYAEICEKPPTPRLMAVLDLLLGNLDLALQSLEDSSMLGWSNKDHPGHIAFPALLLVSTGMIQPESESVLARLWSQLDGVLSLRGGEPDPSQEVFSACAVAQANKIALSCRALLEPALRRVRVSKERRRDLLSGLQRVTLRRVHDIVENRFRGAYERASLVSIACAEAFFMVEEKSSGLELLKIIRQDFPRHRAFHKELSDLQNDSPVLPNFAA
jgi:hypothetical protein